MIEGSPSGEYEDRRTKDDVRYEILYDKFQKGEAILPEDKRWLEAEHLLQQVKHQHIIDDYNRERGFKVPETRSKQETQR